MPGDASDRVPALGLVGCVVLCGIAAVVTFRPDDAYPVETTLEGLPRLGLYLLAGIALALTAPRATRAAVAGWRRGEPADGRGAFRPWPAAWLGLGVLLAIADAVTLRDDITAPTGPALWLASMACVVVAVVPAGLRHARRPRVPRLGPVGAALVALLLLAAAVRFVDLGGVPPNVQADEGDRAGSALDVLDGAAPASWFESGWFYVSMVYFRVLAAVFDVFGVGVVQGRLLNAVAGLVLVGAVAWIGFRDFGRRVGLVATALAAVSPLALQFSRTIAESGVGAALFAVSLAGFLEGGRTGRPWPFALAGLAGGLSLYTYASARAWPLAAGAAVAILLAFGKGRRRVVVRGAAIAAIAAIAAAVPYAVHLSQHPDETTLRYEQTTVLDADNRARLPYLDADTPLPEVLTLQLERSLGVFDRYPDRSDFLPTRSPVLPGLLAVLTLLGVLYALVRSGRDPRLALISVWFWLGLSGMVLTVETPAAQRAAALVVALPLLAAVVACELADRVPALVAATRARWGTASPESGLRASALRRVADALLVAGVAALVGWQLWAYFVDYRHETQPWAVATTEGREVARLGADGPVYAVEREHHMVRSGWVRFLAREVRAGGLPYPARQLPLLEADEPVPPPADPKLAVPIPRAGETVSVLVFDPEERPYVGFLRDLYPGGVLEPTPAGETVFRVGPRAAGRSGGARVIAGGRLLGVVPTFGVVPDTAILPATLTWSAGIRVARSGLHRFGLTAPAGTTLSLDGTTVALTARPGRTAGVLDLAAGLHLVTLRASVSRKDAGVGLRWSGRLGSPAEGAWLRQFTRAQTYASMAVPRGLSLRVVAKPPFDPELPGTQTWLDSGLAADFDGIDDRLPRRGMMTWRGSLVVPRAGTYRFAFLSDMKLDVAVDGRSLAASIDTVRDRGLRLSPGLHHVAVSAELGERRPTYVRWMWIPPARGGSKAASGTWSVVPSSALRPDDAVRRVGALRSS